MPKNPVSVLVMILLASFVIDRVVTALLFLLSYSRAWTARFPDPLLLEEPVEKRVAGKNQKLIYFVLAAVLSLGFVVVFKNIGVLEALDFRASGSATASATAGATDADKPPAPGATRFLPG